VEILLALAWAAPLLVFVVGARIWYPRYVLFTTVPFLALVGGSLAAIWSRAGGRVGRGLVALVLASVLVPGVRFQLGLLRDPASARLPPVDRWQYIEGWPSGYGWDQAHESLLEMMESKPPPHRVATERYHWTLKASFVGRPDVHVKPFDLWRPPELLRAAGWVGRGGGWLVTSKPVGADRPPGLELDHVAGFTKPGRRMSVHVYRLRPTP
jgi:4-amino-4-deoxy-L-arabinose transferase-like glycosyltransferase